LFKPAKAEDEKSAADEALENESKKVREKHPDLDCALCNLSYPNLFMLQIMMDQAIRAENISKTNNVCRKRKIVCAIAHIH
tara:strand:+ start:981 stop:1223 length:243 start_codon:yes stop_codon:yes gene_type:complete